MLSMSDTYPCPHAIAYLSIFFFQAYVDAVHGQKFQLGHANHAWLCLDLLEVLSHLAESGHSSAVRSILDHPLKNFPEVLLLGIAHIDVTFSYVLCVCFHGLHYFVCCIRFVLMMLLF